MKVYVAMTEDRHTDPEAEVFTTPDAAIAFARTRAEDWMSNAEGEDDDGVLRDDYYPHEEQVDGTLYYAEYSTEGDSVWVIEKELQT